jgi:hypothetical protein
MFFKYIRALPEKTREQGIVRACFNVLGFLRKKEGDAK